MDPEKNGSAAGRAQGSCALQSRQQVAIADRTQHIFSNLSYPATRQVSPKGTVTVSVSSGPPTANGQVGSTGDCATALIATTDIPTATAVPMINCVMLLFRIIAFHTNDAADYPRSVL